MDILSAVEEAYEKLRYEVEENCWRRTDRFGAVLKIDIETYMKMLRENHMMAYYVGEYSQYQFILLHGERVPVVFDHKLAHKDVKFVLQLKEDYEKEEMRKLQEKIYMMWEGDIGYE